MTTEVTGSITRLVGGLSEQPVKGPPISPCRFCVGNHWNDSCIIYCTARETKQLLKYRCYVCLQSGHKAFECKVQKTFYFCGRRNHHHRSLCETKFGTLQSRRAQLGNNKEGVSQELKSKHIESTSTKSNCNLQLMDSEEDVYVAQTNMEVEFALTINKARAELEKCRNENLKLKQTISELKKGKETIHRKVSENDETTKRQFEEIADLKERLERLEGNRDTYTRIHQMARLFKSEVPEKNAEGRNETQIHHTAQSSIAKSTNHIDTSRVREQNIKEDVSHGLGVIKMLMKRQEQIQNSELSKGSP